jgi:hypothetical protein
MYLAALVVFDKVLQAMFLYTAIIEDTTGALHAESN